MKGNSLKQWFGWSINQLDVIIKDCQKFNPGLYSSPYMDTLPIFFKSVIYFIQSILPSKQCSEYSGHGYFHCLKIKLTNKVITKM